MKQPVSFDMFVQAFKDFRRASQFSFEALNVIFNYLEDSDHAYELDVIGICCEFSESTIQELIAEYDLDKSEDPEENLQTARSFLEENTAVIGETADGFVYLQF